MRLVLSLCAVLLTLLCCTIFVGCQDSNAQNKNFEIITISISPHDVTLAPGTSVQFSATVTGTSNTDVVWNVEENGGSINQKGFYTAPETTGRYTVTVTSAADRNTSETAIVTVTEESKIRIDPPTAILGRLGTQRFRALGNNGETVTATWTVVTENGGTIAQDGSYTAPDSIGTFVIRATSVDNPTVSNIAEITVLPDPDNKRVDVYPKSVTLPVGGTQLFSAIVTGMADRSVTWSVEGGGAINNLGFYQAPTTPGAYHVTATSNEDSHYANTVTVTVLPAYMFVKVGVE